MSKKQKDNQRAASSKRGMTYKISKQSKERAETLLKAGLHSKVLCWVHWLHGLHLLHLLHWLFCLKLAALAQAGCVGKFGVL